MKATPSNIYKGDAVKINGQQYEVVGIGYNCIYVRNDDGHDAYIEYRDGVWDAEEFGPVEITK